VPLFKMTTDGLSKIVRTDFASVRIRERRDLQRILRDQIEVVDKDLFVISEEFGSWQESKHRIDLLAIDREANLVVIELKRTQDGGYMELQAIRYSALVANMTLEQAVRAHREYLASRAIDEEAEQRILDFLGWEEADEESFGQDVRIILVSADFSKELTTSILWLNEKGLDIRCVRLRPHQLDDQLILLVEQVLPLPEAQEYMTGVREKQRIEAIARSKDYTRFDLEIDGVRYSNLAKRQAIVRVAVALCKSGAKPEDLAESSGRTVSAVWRSADGELSSDQLYNELMAHAYEGGPAFEDRRWFLDEPFLVHSDGKTWAFTKMWGKRTEEVMHRWIAEYPHANIKFQISS
jgi:hypothetical protein